MSFNYCCGSPSITPYSLKHSKLSQKESDACARLIWYLPEIDSFQANHGTPISDDIYEDVFMDITKKILKITDDDIKYFNCYPEHTIDSSDALYYENDICVNCTKIIFAKSKGKNKIVSLLSHLRNSIAHGYFNIIGNTFIGFDHPKYGGLKYTGVIKVANIDDLNELLASLSSIQDLPSLFKYLLTCLGYTTIEGTGLTNDLLIEKEERRYFLQFKRFTGRYINQVDLEQYIASIRHIDKTNCVFVLIVDSTYTNSKINSFLVGENIAIVDKKWVKELVQGRDVFKEITLAKELL